jgi:hypothetical protein
VAGVDVAGEAIILAPEAAPFVATKNKRSTTKTTIYCAAMCTKTEKSVPAARPAIVPNINEKWQSPLKGHVTWHCFHSLVKCYARLSL